MATIARTVHYNDPETGELVTLTKGDEIPDDVAENFNNPSIFEDPDAPGDNDGDLAGLSEEEFYFAADANGQVDPETFDDEREARIARSEVANGGSIDFGNGGSDYSSMRIGQLREEYNRRQAEGVEMPEVDMRDKESLVSALQTNDAGNS